MRLQVTDTPDPETTPADRRGALREEVEDCAFREGGDDHYMADFMEADVYIEASCLMLDAS